MRDTKYHWLSSHFHFHSTNCKTGEKKQIAADKPVPTSKTSATRQPKSSKKRSEKPKPQAICSVCGKDYKTKANLREHMYTHTNEKPIKCPLCPMYFKNLNHVRNHKRNRHTERPQVECKICHKVFKWDAYLQTHMAAAHPEAPADGRKFECYFCHKACNSEVHTRRHMYSHVRSKSVMCPQCGQCFVDMHKLTRHMSRLDHQTSASAEVEKPFVCTECGKAFIDRSSLHKHEMIHLDVCQFDCDVCGKSFKTKGNLRQHNKTHAPEKYFCHLCSHKCRSMGNLQKHMRVHKCWC